MDWKGEAELERMLALRVRRYPNRRRKAIGRGDGHASWYALGFRDGWELATKAKKHNNERIGINGEEKC